MGDSENPGNPPEEEEEEEEEELDPRIQEELEHLNEANAEINRGELELDAARCRYRRVLSDSARKLNSQGSQLGACIDRARPYYEARRRAKEAQQETQRAALRYERAVGMHNAAREMVFVAEQGMGTGKNRLDPTWQEMLNHATRKVNEAEQERLRSEREHRRATRLCQEAEAEVQRLQKSLRRDIARSRPYFELKAQFNLRLEEDKSRVNSLECAVSQAKLRYAVALRNLEQISEEIHARRLQRILRKKKLRESPLGAEGGPRSAEIHGIPGKSPGIPGDIPKSPVEIPRIPGETPGIPAEILAGSGGIPEENLPREASSGMGRIPGIPCGNLGIPTGIPRENPSETPARTSRIPGIPSEIPGIPDETPARTSRIPGIRGEIPEIPDETPARTSRIPGILGENLRILGEIPGIPDGILAGTCGIPGEIPGIPREASPSGDSLSLLSLQSIASDLQKFDSVEHLAGIPGISGIPDALSLHSEELGEGRERRRNFRHHRSVSL
ncbi:SH3 domain-binding protein 5-like [Lonchura striata]